MEFSLSNISMAVRVIKPSNNAACCLLAPEAAHTELTGQTFGLLEGSELLGHELCFLGRCRELRVIARANARANPLAIM